MKEDRIAESKSLALRIRQHVLQMTHDAHSSHIGGCLSIADILAVLYTTILTRDDHFILSKGHNCAALYATLAERGFFPIHQLSTFCQDGSLLSGHVNHHIPGVEVSTGSLGHGLSIGCGMALVEKRVFVLISDGECDEGSTWEAALFAPHHYLDNLTVIIDYNGIQSLGNTKDILELEPLRAKWQAFGWTTKEVDGHNHEQIYDTLSSLPFTATKPSCIIAHTIKGKGVSFMENQVAWHYKSPNNIELQQALQEVKEEKEDDGRQEVEER